MSQRRSPSIHQALAPFARPETRRSAWQLTSTLGGYVAVMSCAHVGLSHGYVIAIGFAPLAALFVVRLFIIQHDCGHGSFFVSRRANNLVGAFLGVLTLTPYHEWRLRHAVHHRVSGNLERRGTGDIPTLTVREYLALSRWRRMAYRASRHPVVLFGIGSAYQFLLRQRLPADLWAARTSDWRSVMGTNLSLLVLAIVLKQMFGQWRFLVLQALVSWTASAIGVWLFYVQHQFERTYWAPEAEWDFERSCLAGSSFLDLHPILRWFTGNIGCHHIHHLSPRVPNYRLPDCLDAHPDLAAVHRLALRDALGCSRLAVWDEQGARLVDFRAHALRDTPIQQ